VFAYYYKGCESWDWYYPYHYAPFASDLINCDRVKINFDLGEPRRPFEQLMCVFPKQSAHALPKCYHWLMSSSQSPIIDFYPTNFKLDINGAAYAWMGVNLLPFIDTKRMQLAMKAADGDMKKLSVAEKQRNKKTGDIQLYFVAGTKSRLQRQLLQEGQVYRSNFESKDEVVGEVTGNPSGIVKLGEPIYVSERG
jgi:5'-3' exoribonuclease 2